MITAITAQNTVKVTQIFELSTDLVAAQIDAVMQDIGAQALKTGMLANAAIIEVTAAKIRHYDLKNLVVDPVMVAKSGDLLLRTDAIQALRSRLIPLAKVVTPNLPEAEELTEMKLTRAKEIEEAARRIIAMGAQNDRYQRWSQKRTGHRLVFRRQEKSRAPLSPYTHSPHPWHGLHLSAAIAAYLAKGKRSRTPLS